MPILPRPLKGGHNEPTERDLFKKDIQIGLDGSVILDDDAAYSFCRRGPRGMVQVDYFHGLIRGVPMAQLKTEAEEPVRADEMISAVRGPTIKAIVCLQRRWRSLLQRR